MRDKLPKVVALINDVEFALGPCSGCGSCASESQALQALDAWYRWYGRLPICAGCGGPIRMSKVTLGHTRSGAWKVMFVTFADCLGFTGFAGTTLHLHGRCGKQALPNANWDALEGHLTRVEEGRPHVPWPFTSESGLEPCRP